MSDYELWEKVHSSRAWGASPSQHLITWAARRFWRTASHLRKKIKILDVGCAEGSGALYLGCEGFSVTAVDISPSAIDRLNKHIKELDLEDYVQGVVGDMRALPFKNREFHGVTDLMASCCAVDNHPGVIKEITRVLKFGGNYLGILPHNDCPLITSSPCPILYPTVNEMQRSYYDSYKFELYSSQETQGGKPVVLWLLDGTRKWN